MIPIIVDFGADFIKGYVPDSNASKCGDNDALVDRDEIVEQFNQGYHIIMARMTFQRIMGKR